MAVELAWGLDQAPERRVGDYVLGPVLGRGAMSVVYRATRGAETFALKLPTDHPDVDTVDLHLQFRREAAALARLEHPALVRVYEVGDDGGRPYLVMDLVEGESLERRIARGPLAEGEAVALARALCAALAEVHRYGLVHRDVKPSNVILPPAGGCKLIDFGLVARAARAVAVVGTLRYAAPEQVGVLKRSVGAPADLYALGATLFEALTGRLPIPEGVAQTDFLHRLATTPAPALTDVRPDASPALAAIVARLLAKDPDDRYQSARGLLADLDDLARLDAAARAGEALALGARDGLAAGDQEVPLVGRRAELAQLTRALDRARAGESVFAQVEGEGGCGKTRLVREVLAAARAAGALVLAGKCQEHDTVPFGPLREAADRFAARALRLPDDARARAVARVRAAAGEYAPLLRRLSVGLARLLPEGEELRHLEPDAEQQRFFDAIAGFFRGLATPASPLALHVDDVQWLDEGSQRVLVRLAHDAPATHLLVLTTARNTAAGAEACEGFARALGAKLAERVRLGPLDPQAVGALARARLGGRALDGPLVEKLAALTHGNPFAVGEYLHALLDGGLLRPTSGRWTADLAGLEALALPTDIIDLMVGRLATLGAATARLVGLAGVLGNRFGLDLLARVAGTSPEDAARAVEDMVREDLVERVDAEVFAFVHDRIREAAIAGLSDDARRDTHQAIAACLDAVADTSPGHRYALARHYAQGHTDRAPRRACETNLAAGLLALDEHANEVAFELLDRAHDLAAPAGLQEAIAMQLHEGLGRACAMTGRLDRAFAHLEEALRRARDAKDRFRLQYLLTLTYASQGRNDDALASLFEAFRVIGRPFPRWTVVQGVSLVWTWLLALVLRRTGSGHGRARGEERERRQILSQLHYAGSMIALFQGRPLLMVQFVVRDFLNVHFLGATAEAAIAYALYGAVLGLCQLRGAMETYTRLGVGIAEQIGDNAARAVCRAYQAVGMKWAGDLAEGNRMLVEEGLPDLQRHVPGSWYQAMMIGEQAYSYLHGGLSGAAIEHIRANASQLDRTNNLMYRYNTMSVLYAELMVSGQMAEASALWEKLEPLYEPLRDTIYVRLARCIARLEVLNDEEETGAAVDAEIAAFHDLVSEDYYSNAARMLVGYARLAQYRAADDGQRPAARQRFEEATRALALRALAPVFQCHALVFRAVLAQDDGQRGKARRLLARADKLAARCGSRRGAYHAALERARVERAAGEPTARFYAQAALDVALAERWRRKAARVRAEFDLKEEVATRGSSRTLATAHADPAVDRTRRFADALLQVSLASTSTLDPVAQARRALEEVARLLGAERALFYLADPDTGALALTASAGADARQASQSVVKRVVETRAPVVLTGTDGAALSSASIVAYGLRSVLAAPLLLRDRLVGVVYLDSRLAKGMFTQDDVALLLGVSSHIAIALETARTARLEAERSVMARDLEVLGAVQALLLPKAVRFEAAGVRGAGCYQPAAQCSGDWWWQEPLTDGTTLLLLGDVSGHGAGPAMISSAVAGAFRTTRALKPDAGPAEILHELDRCVRTFGSGFHMTMSAARVDPVKRTLSWWNAAGPEAFVLRGAKLQCLAAPGTVLGDAEPLRLGEVTVPFGPGDRLLLCTDGVLELKRQDGRPLGVRQVGRLFSQFAPLALDDARARLASELNAVLAGRAQEDDITFLMVESLPAEECPESEVP